MKLLDAFTSPDGYTLEIPDFTPSETETTLVVTPHFGESWSVLISTELLHQEGAWGSMKEDTGVVRVTDSSSPGSVHVTWAKKGDERCSETTWSDCPPGGDVSIAVSRSWTHYVFRSGTDVLSLFSLDDGSSHSIPLEGAKVSEQPEGFLFVSRSSVRYFDLDTLSITKTIPVSESVQPLEIFPEIYIGDQAYSTTGLGESTLRRTVGIHRFRDALFNIPPGSDVDVPDLHGFTESGIGYATGCSTVYLWDPSSEQLVTVSLPRNGDERFNFGYAYFPTKSGRAIVCVGRLVSDCSGDDSGDVYMRVHVVDTESHTVSHSHERVISDVYVTTHNDFTREHVYNYHQTGTIILYSPHYIHSFIDLEDNLVKVSWYPHGSSTYEIPEEFC